jgi:hypothetical protein
MWPRSQCGSARERSTTMRLALLGRSALKPRDAIKRPSRSQARVRWRSQAGELYEPEVQLDRLPRALRAVLAAGGGGRAADARRRAVASSRPRRRTRPLAGSATPESHHPVRTPSARHRSTLVLLRTGRRARGMGIVGSIIVGLVAGAIVTRVRRPPRDESSCHGGTSPARPSEPGRQPRGAERPAPPSRRRPANHERSSTRQPQAKGAVRRAGGPRDVCVPTRFGRPR